MKPRKGKVIASCVSGMSEALARCRHGANQVRPVTNLQLVSGGCDQRPGIWRPTRNVHAVEQMRGAIVPHVELPDLVARQTASVDVPGRQTAPPKPDLVCEAIVGSGVTCPDAVSIRSTSGV